jgi:Ni/Fe-hydrogenase subunit HybB-like protein
VGYSERNTVAQLLASLAGVIVYVVIVAPQLGRPVDDIDWVWPMVWTIGGAIVLSIVLSIGWGMVAGARDPESGHTADQRDREIDWFGERVGAAFMVIGSLGALILTMLEVHWFWIGQAIFFGFFLSAFIGGLARLSAYRRGFQ